MTGDEFDPTGILPILDGEIGFEEAAALTDGEAETLRRLEIETLGLLASTLEPVAPRAGARERLYQALAASSNLAPVVSLAAVRAERTAAAAPVARTGLRWGLAAGLLIGALGLGTAGWLVLEQTRVENQLARVEGERAALVAELRERERQLSAEREARFGEVSRRNEALQLVATRGVAVCPLRPVGQATTLQPDSFAVLYMAPAQRTWYVKASKLAPPPPGRTYRVWFESENGPVYVGDLRPAPDYDLQFEAAGFEALVMKGVKVTLELPGQHSEPSGPMVLFGDDKMMVL